MINQEDNCRIRIVYFVLFRETFPYLPYLLSCFHFPDTASLIIIDCYHQIAPGIKLDFVYPLRVAFKYYPLKLAIANEFGWFLLNLCRPIY